MATTPMTFKIEIQQDEWRNHLLCKLWNKFPLSHPIYGHENSFPLFLKEYNINMIDWNYNYKIHHYVIEFHSEQDYILWHLYQ